jgi:predicted lipoprotein
VRRRGIVVAAAALAATRFAHAQADWRRVAVPYVTPQAWLQSLDAHWYAPRAAAFAQAAQRLADTLPATGCAAPGASRTVWRDTMLAWEALAALQTGALVERRSARTLDFQPARPAAIERALADPGRELVLAGAPALGLPALEWLLWRAPRSDAVCAYAHRVAAHLATEARTLAEAYATPRERDDETLAQRDFEALLNQLVGGVATLRWGLMGRPRREGKWMWPRSTSRLTREAWRARMQALQQLLAYQDANEAPVALESFLRGRGLNPLADRVRTASRRAAAAVATATPAAPASVAAAERALGALESLLSQQVAPTLNVTIGFSDSDGD